MRVTGVRVVAAVIGVLGLAAGGAVWAQTPTEVTKTDITKQQKIDSSQYAVLGVRLGDPKDAAMKTLQRISNITVQDDAASRRIFVFSPANSKTVVMSLKVVENQVTTINLVGGFGEWLQGDTKTLFKAFEDDSLRHKLVGREDGREAARAGTKEAPTVDITYAYFKEGLLFHYALRGSADGKQVETAREIVLIYPARSR